MPTPSRAILYDLPKGHEFPPTMFELSADYVGAYLAATQDSNSVYADAGFAPPLAIAARSLGALLEIVELPAGSLHTGQEVAVTAGVAIPTSLEWSGRIAQRSERAGLMIVALEFQVSEEAESAAILTGRTTIMMPEKTSA